MPIHTLAYVWDAYIGSHMHMQCTKVRHKTP